MPRKCPTKLLRLCLSFQLLGLLVSSDSFAQSPIPESACANRGVNCRAKAGDDETHASETARSTQERGPGIQDNSFLIEEAYNQEFGVVQHIQAFQRLWNSKDWVYTFTQEWPVDRRPRNQLSYTLILAHSGSYPGAGMGDIILNYRYQLVGDGESAFAFAPRISALLPTGSSRLGRGAGSTGIQTNMPVSVFLSDKLVTHWNLGATFIPAAHNASGERAATFGYNFGQSFVWLAHPRFNAILETVISRNQSVTAPNRTEWNSTLLLNPGIRWAHNFKNGLQIVPGLGVPVGIGPGSGEKGIFLYVSFEHPYRNVMKNHQGQN